MSAMNIQVWQDGVSGEEPRWIVERCDDMGADTVADFATREGALAAASRLLAEGAELMECWDCGVLVEPQGDHAGCGSHCPNCYATL
jgi:hypothetical protein